VKMVKLKSACTSFLPSMATCQLKSPLGWSYFRFLMTHWFSSLFFWHTVGIATSSVATSPVSYFKIEMVVIAEHLSARQVMVKYWIFCIYIYIFICLFVLKVNNGSEWCNSNRSTWCNHMTTAMQHCFFF